MPSPVRGFLALILFTLKRQWRTRALGLVSLALLALMTATIAIITHVQKAWPIETRVAWITDAQKPEGKSIRMNYAQYGVERLPLYEMLPGPAGTFGQKAAVVGAYQFLLLADEARSFREDYAFVNFSRWVIFGLYLTFLLPLFMLAFASNSLGGEREARTLIWLVTRPLPRQAVYVAKFLGVLPWCVAAAFLGFACLCLVGGDLGRRAFIVYWPSVLVGSIAFAALFHFIGALFRWPAVVGLVYIFFFEFLVNNLPGSLKRLSLNYYIRSLLYSDVAEVAPSVRPGIVDVYDPLGSTVCWIVLLSATVVITTVGAILFSRQEPQEEL